MNQKSQNDLQKEETELSSLLLAKKRGLKREIKTLKKSEDKTREALKECADWEKKEHEANLLKAHFKDLKKGLKKIRVLDWLQDNLEIFLELDETKSPQDLLKKAFKKAKKLKTGIEHQERQLLFIQNKLVEKENLLSQIEQIASLEDFQKWFPKKILQKKKNELKPHTKTVPYRQYISEEGVTIWVGKNSRANDALTFHYAKGSDLWLHVKDFPGSHVVIKIEKKGNAIKIDNKTIQEAAQLAIFYSKAKLLNQVEICLTEQKYVSRFGKKRDGKVQISKQRSFFVTRDLNKLQKIRNRSN